MSARAIIDIEVGERVVIQGRAGKVVTIRHHGTSIGNGVEEWVTLRVRFDGQSYLNTVGPRRATDLLHRDPVREQEAWIHEPARTFTAEEIRRQSYQTYPSPRLVPISPRPSDD